MIVMVAGVYGVGKSTICSKLSDDLKLNFAAVDDLGLAGDPEITGFLNYCDLFFGRVPYIPWGRCHEQIHRGHLLKVARLRRGSPRPDSRRDGSDVIGPAGQAIRSEQGASNSACRTKRCNHSCDATALPRNVRSGILSRTNGPPPDRAT